MKFDDASKVDQLVWDMRIADLPRSENRAILQRLYNGDPPYDAQTARENNIEINRNDLEGVNLLAQGRRQWDNAFLKPGNYFNVTLDRGPRAKRVEWGHAITRAANRILKRRRPMIEQARATGGNAMIYGIGPSNWADRRTPIPTPMMLASLMIPSETDVSFENLSYFAIFREWTVEQLYRMTHGAKVDPGWNMPMVRKQMALVGEQTQKQMNATSYQYMPEKIEEIVKQDLGYWGSDATPTVDVWDFYFREKNDGDGWYRRIILDWGLEGGVTRDAGRPVDRQRLDNDDTKGTFLYSSGSRKFANHLSEILHCQYSNCSAIFPQKFHSVRGPGWMLWGVCDLQNRLHCKFNEQVFQQLMWFFRVASDTQLNRLKQVNFAHMGVIPNGVEWLKAADRFQPDLALVQMAFGRNQALMSENSSAFTQDFDKGTSGKEMTATETMARVNSVNALVSGTIGLAYTYEEFKYREIMRRLCLKNNTDRDAKRFVTMCLEDGVSPEVLQVDCMEITAERVLGAGNKTVEMAGVNFLQSIRKNLTPQAQRRVDHIAIESATDDPALAEELAPTTHEDKLSSSAHDAELATERLLKGLPYRAPAQAVPEDYVTVWLQDMALLVQQINANGAVATRDQIVGLTNIGKHIGDFLQMMESNTEPEEKQKTKQYADLLGKLMNHVRAFEQRLAKQQQANAAGAANGNGNGQAAKAMLDLQTQAARDRQKLQNSQASHAQKTAQRQVQFEMDQQRQDREANARIRRENLEFANDIARKQVSAFAEPSETETARSE